ncbi:MAG TPA: hypothetical protein VF916_14930, partial [Ktedonobacterales bacterium]
LPWQRPLPPERRTPARVRRGVSYLLAQVGRPARVPQPCGRSPARPKGQRSPPAQRVPAVKLTPYSTAAPAPGTLSPPGSFLRGAFVWG